MRRRQRSHEHELHAAAPRIRLGLPRPPRVEPGDRRARVRLGGVVVAPKPEFEAIRDRISFYPGRVDAAWLGEERVTPPPGDHCGGWITAEIEVPFKGEPGTEGR